MERLQKVIANLGYCSRRRAEELIKQGKVYVNDIKITELGTKVSDKDKIEVENHFLEKGEKVYILLNKPRGVISSVSDDKGRKTVIDLITTKERIYPVGRLDYDTTGLLLLTNDGFLANALTHPKNEIEKVYVAKVKGIINSDKLKCLRQGLVIDGYKTAKAKVKISKYDKKTLMSIIEITIHEGKNHQVKKMFEAVGCEVVKLKRESLSFLNLSGLNSGEYRYLNPKEVKKLFNEAVITKE
ncbi:MAG: pseudouridine synthase [Bacilli bacterium]|nr:pseudouridine synthase [Bacilli bacterium]